MTIFQFICKCYAIIYNTCKVHVHCFLVVWFIHPYFGQLLTESLQNFNCGRWQMSFLLPKYNVINIFKLKYLRYFLSDWDQTCFGKNRMTVTFFHKNYILKSLPVSQTWRHSAINYGYISLILRSIESQFGHRDRGSPWCHIKYYVTLKVTVTFGVNGNVNSYSFYRLVYLFITPPILDRITSNYQLCSLTNKLPVAQVLRHHYI